ncbi:MAG: transcription antitermination factor NusB [Gammaproteobacteria bacterium]|nr:transcription antitermination factor NusB [Gammaproteobacteria bacterium]MBQ0841112.1 transcription antitermination factor NusB [Gammaproteobacteria bacterium]
MLVQALYQWQLSGTDIAAIEAQYMAEKGMAKADSEFFRELLHEIPVKLDELDAAYREFLDRDPQALDPISLAVLRIGVYELLHRIDVPYRVVINESVNLAKTFGPTDAYKYINGIVDRVAARARRVEIAGSKGGRSDDDSRSQ